MRILYVEDNEVNQALVARVSRVQNHELLFCSEGEQALELLAEDSAIDLILMDIELAGVMTGLDVVQTMRARNDKRPVVAVTAYAMMGDREKMLDAGCDQYLPKPLQIPDLLSLFNEYAARFSALKVEDAVQDAAANAVADAAADAVAEPVKDAADTAADAVADTASDTVADAVASTEDDAHEAEAATQTATESAETDAQPQPAPHSGNGITKSTAASAGEDESNHVTAPMGTAASSSHTAED